MEPQFSTNQDVECWKQHHCVCCQSSFRYRLRRKVVASGLSRLLAAQKARRAARWARWNAIDMHPCPVCGLYQPDMIGARRSKAHAWICGAVAASLGIVFLLGMFRWLSMPAATWSVGGLCALAFVAHLLAEWPNPNRNRERNRNVAGQRLTTGALEFLQQGPDADAPVPRERFRRAVWHYLGAFLLGAMPFLAITGEGLRIANDWPLNLEWSPPVAGPGDSTTYAFDDTFSSIKGMWKGKGTANLVNADALGLSSPTLKTSTRAHDRWDGTILAKSTDRNRTVNHVWIGVEIPKDAKLEGKTLRIDLRLLVDYPEYLGNSTYVDQQHALQQTAELTLASPRAGEKYEQATMFCVPLAAGGAIFLGLLIHQLSSGLRRRAVRATVIDVKQEDDPEMPDWVRNSGP